MTDKDLIKRIILENQERIPQLRVFKRDLSLSTGTNYIITGQRRAGKTYLLYRHLLKLIETGTPVNLMLYINFEDERLLEMDVTGLDLIIESYKELFGEEPLLFFDEIQNISGWQKFARRLADSGYNVMITGSNAEMLSSEMASTLGGRFLVKELETLSFREYLLFHNVEVDESTLYSGIRFDVQRLFEGFFYYGGFPELYKFENKKEYLSNIFQKIFLGDIITRHQIRNPHALKLMVKKLAESTMDEVSFTRIRNIIQSTGIQVGTATLIEYLSYFKDAFLIESLSNYPCKITERETKKKYYFRDHGLLSLFLVEPEAFLLETIVFNHLRQKYPGNLFYLRNEYEVDFFVPEKILIQVSYKLDSHQTRKRELSALLKAADTYKPEELIVVTSSQEETVTENGYHIRVIPAWKWLLEETGIDHT